MSCDNYEGKTVVCKCVCKCEQEYNTWRRTCFACEQNYWLDPTDSQACCTNCQVPLGLQIGACHNCRFFCETQTCMKFRGHYDFEFLTNEITRSASKLMDTHPEFADMIDDIRTRDGVTLITLSELWEKMGQNTRYTLSCDPNLSNTLAQAELRECTTNDIKPISPDNKPAAVWMSYVQQHKSNNWIDFVCDDQFKVEDLAIIYAAKIKCEEKMRKLVLVPEDLDHFHEKYMGDDTFGFADSFVGPKYINWDKVRNDYDIVEIVEYKERCHNSISKMMWYWLYDANSTMVFDPHNVEVRMAAVWSPLDKAYVLLDDVV